MQPTIKKFEFRSTNIWILPLIFITLKLSIAPCVPGKNDNY